MRFTINKFILFFKIILYMGGEVSKPQESGPIGPTYDNPDTDYSLYQIESCKPAYEVMMKLFEYKESLKKLVKKYEVFLQMDINFDSKIYNNQDQKNKNDQIKTIINKLSMLEKELDEKIKSCKDKAVDPEYLTLILTQLNEYKKISHSVISSSGINYSGKLEKYKGKLKNLELYKTSRK